VQSITNASGDAGVMPLLAENGMGGQSGFLGGHLPSLLQGFSDATQVCKAPQLLLHLLSTFRPADQIRYNPLACGPATAASLAQLIITCQSMF